MSNHRTSRRPALLAAAMLGGLLLAGTAAAQDVEKTVAYRQGIFKALSWHIGPIAGMAKGEVPFDTASLKHHADGMAALALLIHEGFPEGSGPVEGSRAREEIWSDPETFQARAANLAEQTAILAARAPFLTQETLGEALGAVGGACKACHDDFRAAN